MLPASSIPSKDFESFILPSPILSKVSSNFFILAVALSNVITPFSKSDTILFIASAPPILSNTSSTSFILFLSCSIFWIAWLQSNSILFFCNFSTYCSASFNSFLSCSKPSISILEPLACLKAFCNFSTCSVACLRSLANSSACILLSKLTSLPILYNEVVNLSACVWILFISCPNFSLNPSSAFT